MTTKELFEEKIAAILDYASDNEDFDTEFILSIAEQLEKKGTLSAKQMNAVDNIIDEFKINV